ALPALIVGTWAGGRVFARLSEGNYRRAAIGLLAITAGISALRGLNGLP
ncbi:MAG TPA: sulfite exporter TauE/SafE family protein, partial [Tistrella mobilis]|nr:sulfite exporter TauE/SafE family protein [Tistrella mobilis]